MKQEEAYFEELYQTNYQRVIRICSGYVNGDEALAKDLAQEVFIKVWQSLASFRNESNIATWIYRIAVNTCMLQFRKKKFFKDVKAIEELSVVEKEDQSAKECQLTTMYQCINKLSKENKGIILLELEGIPQKEIAKVMGLSHEATRVRVHRIKINLTKCVKNGSI